MSAVTYDCSDPMEVPSDSQLCITVERYHQMGEAGIFREDEHVELLQGKLVAREPQGGDHGSMIQYLTRLLVRGVGDAYDVRAQLSLALGPLSEPEPDFAVVPARMRGAAREHPRTAILIVEVARTSLRIDRGVKAALYARAGVPDYWIINLRDSVVEVHRDPDPAHSRYRNRQVLQGDDVLAPLDLPGPSITVAELFAWG
jgi:Uma2 family endonuclease